ncbi:MAG: hypothetical protein HYY84_11150 [Deltaproteobacteria bacterium]|nr:hypothetical protein [Deltaproteobacteria bacterium]
MQWSTFDDEPRAVAKLRAVLARGRLHHAWILAGLDIERATSLAKTFAAVLLCPNATDEACGACGPCARIAAGTHADFILVAPEGEGSTRVIKIDTIRTVVHAVSLAPLEGERKVVVVRDAGRMTRDAQNALLKTLEEPPASTTLVLVAHQIEALLPTIRSRCLKVSMKLRPLTHDADDASIAEFFDALRRDTTSALAISERWASEKDDIEHRLDALYAALAKRAVVDARALAGVGAVATARGALRGYANVRLTLDWLVTQLRSEGVA